MSCHHFSLIFGLKPPCFPAVEASGAPLKHLSKGIIPILYLFSLSNRYLRHLSITEKYILCQGLIRPSLSQIVTLWWVRVSMGILSSDHKSHFPPSQSQAKLGFWFCYHAKQNMHGLKWVTWSGPLNSVFSKFINIITWVSSLHPPYCCFFTKCNYMVSDIRRHHFMNWAKATNTSKFQTNTAIVVFSHNHSPHHLMSAAGGGEIQVMTGVSTPDVTLPFPP